MSCSAVAACLLTSVLVCGAPVRHVDVRLDAGLTQRGRGRVFEERNVGRHDGPGERDLGCVSGRKVRPGILWQVYRRRSLVLK